MERIFWWTSLFRGTKNVSSAIPLPSWRTQLLLCSSMSTVLQEALLWRGPILVKYCHDWGLILSLLISKSIWQLDLKLYSPTCPLSSHKVMFWSLVFLLFFWSKFYRKFTPRPSWLMCPSNHAQYFSCYMSSNQNNNACVWGIWGSLYNLPEVSQLVRRLGAKPSSFQIWNLHIWLAVHR